MGSGRVPAAVAVLVALLALGARSAYGTRPSAFFLYGMIAECQFLNGTERVRLVERQIYNRQQTSHFDSDVGKFVADAPVDEKTVEIWNSDTEFLEYLRGAVDTYCRLNYGALEPVTVQRSVQPKVRVSALQSGSLGESDRLACYVTGFYPPEIEVKWFQNGREETERVVSTDVMQNGDWTYQVLVVLETVPRRGDSYECRVEHASLPQGISQPWEPPSDAGRSKMLTGVGGFVLGLVFLALGLFMFLRSQKGPTVCPHWHQILLKSCMLELLLLLLLLVGLSVWVFQQTSPPPSTAQHCPEPSGRNRMELSGNPSIEQYFCQQTWNSSAAPAACLLCPQFWRLLGERCYRLSIEKGIWTRAKEECEYQQSQLVVLRNVAEKDELKEMAGVGNQPVWIGLQVSRNEWQWVDKSSFNSTENPSWKGMGTQPGSQT